MEKVINYIIIFMVSIIMGLGLKQNSSVMTETLEGTSGDYPVQLFCESKYSVKVTSNLKMSK